MPFSLQPKFTGASHRVFRLLRSCPKWGRRELAKAVVKSEAPNVAIELRFDTVRSNDEFSLAATLVYSVQFQLETRIFNCKCPNGTATNFWLLATWGCCLRGGLLRLSLPDLDRPFMAAGIAAKTNERC